MGILHETGHALGLKHGHEFPVAISADRDSVEYSVMTYRSYPGPGPGRRRLHQRDLGLSADADDVRHRRAAADLRRQLQHSTASNSDLHLERDHRARCRSTAAPANGAPGGNRIFMTIWDGGGNDTYDLSNYVGARP